MATGLFLKLTKNNGIGETYFDMDVSTTTGPTQTGVVNTAASGTEIQWTTTAGGSVLQWVSGRAPVGGFTLTSADMSLWAKESNMSANCGGRIRIFKREANGTETEIGGGPFNDGVEFGTADAEFNWTANVTDTAFAEDDRILLKVYITNVGTMASGHTCTMSYEGIGTLNSSLLIAETVTFKPEATRSFPPFNPYRFLPFLVRRVREFFNPLPAYTCAPSGLLVPANDQLFKKAA